MKFSLNNLIDLDLFYFIIKRFTSASKIGDKLNLSRSTICNILLGNTVCKKDTAIAIMTVLKLEPFQEDIIKTYNNFYQNDENSTKKIISWDDLILKIINS